jgi:hypothetical protein
LDLSVSITGHLDLVFGKWTVLTYLLFDNLDVSLACKSA